MSESDTGPPPDERLGPPPEPVVEAPPLAAPPEDPVPGTPGAIQDAAGVPPAEEEPTRGADAPMTVTVAEPAAGLLFQARARLETEIADARMGKAGKHGVAQERLTELCGVVDYWLADDMARLVNTLGLLSLGDEIKKDYVTASFLAWRGEYKIAYITLRSFLESFCLLLYYLNQGCDRLLYLKGQGYKLMLHRMAQNRPVPDDTHAFRRHYHLLIAESYGSAKAATKFFDEIESCYGSLSKAVHGDYSATAEADPGKQFLASLETVLRICNTLALHEPMLDATEDDLERELGGVLQPCLFQWGPK